MTITHLPNANVTIAEILRQAASLTMQERKDLVKQLVDSFEVTATTHRRHLHELRGVGKELWYKIDAQEYVDQLRDEWDN